MLQTYYWLVKPGIVYGNVMTAAAGFLLASKRHFSFVTFITVIVGTSLVVACGCVLNNYIDRGIDKKMDRTSMRALVSGKISLRSALIYAAGLGLIGFVILAVYTNLLTVATGAVGLFFYVVVYSAAKRRTVHGTLIGTISGATPPVAGYTAVSGRLDAGALILFLILICWQMPHFYAIAIYRSDDYAAARIPVLPLKKGMRNTKLQMLGYIMAFSAAAVALTVFGYTGHTYLVVMVLVDLAWLGLALQGFKTKDDIAWARKLFRFSLAVTLVFSIMISINARFP